MISYREGDVRFIVRAAGAALHQGHVLIHQAEGDGFWALPGGRGELLEPTRATLQREFMEELGAEVEVGRLLWVVEGFYGRAGRRYHELGFYYLTRFPHDSPFLDLGRTYMGEEYFPKRANVPLTFRWAPVAELPEWDFYPVFLRTALAEPPETTVHLVAGPDLY